MGKIPIKALIVDDEKVIRDFLTRLLELEGLEIKATDDGYAALEMAGKENFQIAFLDMRIPRMDGLQILRELKKINPGIRCVMMTGYAVDNLLEEAKTSGAAGAIKKPFEIDEILAQIKSLRLTIEEVK